MIEWFLLTSLNHPKDASETYRGTWLALQAAGGLTLVIAALPCGDFVLKAAGAARRKKPESPILWAFILIYGGPEIQTWHH